MVYIGLHHLTQVRACWLIHLRVQDRLLIAAKARISRMIKDKSKRKDLEVPDFVKTKWNSGPKAKDEMAELLKNANFQKDSVSFFLSTAVCIMLAYEPAI